MLIGAHVSPAGGLANAVERGTDRGCEAIQIFNQSPRAWRPTNYGEADFAAFREAIRGSRIKSVVIHAVYLINCASEDEQLCENSLRSLVHSLTVGAAIGADGVVLHAGSALKSDPAEAIGRAGKLIARALAQTEGCDLHLEDTAGSGATLGRSFEELAALIDAAGGDDRLGICLDSCHLLASGYDVRTPESLTAVLDEADRVVGLDRLRSLHVNDSSTPLGSNVDRHGPFGDGQIGPRGLAVFLSEPRFEGLPAILEGPGMAGKGIDRADVKRARQLRQNGLRRRRRAA